MKYDIYFHDDFDGAASAAVMLSFLESRGDTIVNFTPLDFDVIPKWESRTFKNPAIILDFPYHPKATFWFDHHPTTFKKEEWKNNFKADAQHVLDSKYPSCCHLVYDVLVNRHGFKPPRHLKELVKWLDVIDAAKFSSAEQIVKVRGKALELYAFQMNTVKTPMQFKKLVKDMATKSIGQIVREPVTARTIKRILEQKKKTLEFYRKHIVQIGRLTFIDISKNKLSADARFAPYYIYPSILYAVLLKLSKTGYHISVGVNPWRKKDLDLDIGKLLQKYGGGGHKGVGGLELKKQENIPKVLNEIFAALNKNSGFKYTKEANEVLANI